MEEDLLEFDESQINWTDKEIFIGFFTKPQMTFDYVVLRYYNKYVVVILVLYGVLKSLEKNVQAFDISWGQILFNAILGGVFGWLGMYIWGGILLLVSRIFKGVADIGQMVRVCSYAFIPSLLAILYKILVLVGIRSFVDPSFSSYNELFLPSAFIYSVYALSIIGTIWTLVLSFFGVRRVSEFSMGKAVATVLIPLLVLFVFLIIVFALMKVNGATDWSYKMF